MKLVIDTNVVISALLRDSTTRILLTSPSLTLYAPDYMLEELSFHEKEIVQKSGIPQEALFELKSGLLKFVTFVKPASYEKHLNPSKIVLSDHFDAPFLALAISLNLPIWSQDKALKRQAPVTVITTNELIEILRTNSSEF